MLQFRFQFPKLRFETRSMFFAPVLALTTSLALAFVAGTSYAQTPPPGTSVHFSQARFAVPSPYAGTMPNSPYARSMPPLPPNFNPAPGHPDPTLPLVPTTNGAATDVGSNLPPIISGKMISPAGLIGGEEIAGEPIEFGSAEFPVLEMRQPATEFDQIINHHRAQNKTVWFSAVEATFLRPKMGRPNANTTIFDNLRSVGASVQASDLDSYYAAPRVTLGMQRDKGAIVFRYWNLDFSEVEYMDLHDFARTGQPTQIANAFDQFEVSMYTMDVELQKKLNFKNCDTKLILGSRYVDYQSSAFAQVAELFPNDIYGSFNRYHEVNYKGLGFVTGLSGSKSLRRGWDLNWSGRASGIFGDYFQHMSQVGAFNGDFAQAEANIDNGNSSTHTLTRNPTPGYDVEARANAAAPDNDTLWIFEGQIGLSYSRPLANIPATGHFGFGFEYQYWDLPGGFVDAAISLGSGVLQDPTTHSAGVNLTGFNVSAGITY